MLVFTEAASNTGMLLYLGAAKPDQSDEYGKGKQPRLCVTSALLGSKKRIKFVFENYQRIWKRKKQEEVETLILQELFIMDPTGGAKCFGGW